MQIRCSERNRVWWRSGVRDSTAMATVPDRWSAGRPAHLTEMRGTDGVGSACCTHARPAAITAAARLVATSPHPSDPIRFDPCVPVRLARLRPESRHDGRDQQRHGRKGDGAAALEIIAAGRRRNTASVSGGRRPLTNCTEKQQQDKHKGRTAQVEGRNRRSYEGRKSRVRMLRSIGCWLCIASPRRPLSFVPLLLFPA